MMCLFVESGKFVHRVHAGSLFTHVFVKKMKCRTIGHGFNFVSATKKRFQRFMLGLNSYWFMGALMQRSDWPEPILSETVRSTLAP